MSRLKVLFLLYLFVENGLRLTTITLLLAIITTFTLSSCRIFALLVLGYFVGPMYAYQVSVFIKVLWDTHVCFLHCLPLQTKPCKMTIPDQYIHPVRKKCRNLTRSAGSAWIIISILSYEAENDILWDVDHFCCLDTYEDPNLRWKVEWRTETRGWNLILILHSWS